MKIALIQQHATENLENNITAKTQRTQRKPSRFEKNIIVIPAHVQDVPVSREGRMPVATRR